MHQVIFRLRGTSADPDREICFAHPPFGLVG